MFENIRGGGSNWPCNQHSQQMQIDTALVEQLAQQALYSTDHHIKQQAEHQFEQLLFRIPLDSMDFIHLFERHSETVVLASAAKLAQNVSKIDNLGIYLDKINSIFRHWFNSGDGRFYRQNGQALQKYVVNTIGLFLGRSLKYLFQMKGNEQSVISWLKMPEQGDKYRLYLFLTFIQSVSLIDGSLSFVTYKILLQSFQEEVIPEMLECLYPYFINFSQDIEVAGLSAMQGKLNLKDNPQAQKEFQKSKTFTQFSFSIFQLLSQIINFKYNLNFKEFDQSQQIKGTISFPESVINQIIKKDFLQALYSIITRLLELPPAENYFNLCLQCLEKILCVKITYVPESILSKFIGINLKGIVELFDIILDKKLGNENSLTRVVDCSNMFLEIFGVCHISDLQKLDSKYHEYFQRLVQRIYTLPLLIMEADSPLNAENLLFLGSVQMMQTIGADLTILKIQNNLPIVKSCYLEFVKLFFSKFFISSTNILGDVTFRSLEEFKKTNMSFSQKIVNICSTNYLIVFSALKELLVNLYTNFEQNQINIANILLFLSAALEIETFFDVNINNEYIFDQKEGVYIYQSELKALAELLFMVCQFISTYETIHEYSSIPINNALTLFYAAMLTKFVRQAKLRGAEDAQSIGNELEIKDRVFILMKNYSNIKDDQFLLEGLMGLSKLIKKTEITCIEFIFECLHKLISTIKHKFIRENFKYTPIYREMLSLFNSLVGEKLNPDLMKWRVLLFKSLSLLCFDDALDDYRSNIRNAIILIKSSQQNEMDRVLYDLTGICDGIESSIIFDYFLTKLLSQINLNELMTRLYQRLGGKESFLKDILHLSYLMIQQKDGEEEISKLYEIIDSTLPFWNHVLDKIGNDEERIELFQEIYLIEKTMIAEGHINLAVVDERSPVELRKFIYFTINHIKYMLDHIESYPQLIKTFFDLIHLFFFKLKNLLYNHEESDLALKLTDLLYTIMGRVVSQFQNVINQSYNPMVFQMTLKTLESFFKYLKDSREIIHRKMHNEHERSITELNEEKQRFIMHIFMLGLHFGGRKDSETVKTLTNIAMNTSLCYQFGVAEMAERIGIEEQKDKNEFIRIVTYIKKGQQIEWIFYQLQDWFKIQNRFLENTTTSAIIDGY